MSTPAALARAIRAAARARVLLVACDFDGTIAPIAPSPDAARPCADSVRALRALRLLPATSVAVVSGRPRRQLAKLLGPAARGITLIGLHGAEFDAEFCPTPSQRKAITRIRAAARQAARPCPGALVEPKPAGAALHVRGAPSRTAAADALRAFRDHVLTVAPDAKLRPGKQVLEADVAGGSKVEAVKSLRDELGASAVVFAGDDRTDEYVFPVLVPPDLGIKVGRARSAARFRVRDVRAVGQLLAELADLRAEIVADAAFGGFKKP